MEENVHKENSSLTAVLEGAEGEQQRLLETGLSGSHMVRSCDVVDTLAVFAHLMRSQTSRQG